jgi:phage terminase large subunit-like protein
VVENAHFGQAVVDALKQLNIYAKLISTAVPRVGDTAKVTRATKLIAAAEQGHLLLPQDMPLWAREAVDELCTFTGLAKVPSDRVDALSHAVNYLLSENASHTLDSGVYSVFQNFGRVG